MKPNDTLEIEILSPEGVVSNQSIFMSYGLLNILCEHVGNYQNIPTIDFNPELSATVVLTMLIPRHPSGKPKVALKDFEAPGLSIDQAGILLDWMKEHVLSFFMQRMLKNLAIVKIREKEMEIIKSSANGLTGSLSPT